MAYTNQQSMGRRKRVELCSLNSSLLLHLMFGSVIEGLDVMGRQPIHAQNSKELSSVCNGNDNVVEMALLFIG